MASLALVFCFALTGAPETKDRAPQAYAHALIAELHIARGEWRAAEDALRYALVFDYDDRYLRGRLDAVLVRLGKAPACTGKAPCASKIVHAGKRVKKTLRLPARLSERIDQRAQDPSVAEK
jgi:hypothetical protein